MAIRPVTPDDFDAWMPLWQGYQRFYKAEIPDAVSRTTWKRMLDPAEPIWSALAWKDGRALGMVNYIFHRSTWTTGDYCYLQDLFVDDAARGTGFGRALIEHVYEAAEQAGAARVYWLTHGTNATAMALYDRVADKSGFIQYRKMLP
ncbi:GNAT family N-acetyltransferase [Microvirga pudoricolor]|uniref:GNAT family N-acetyltransferase n=1 Tax=Microvirga pudoricolor TaxID=2778729 RepID=UPI001951D01F|nr:GNAT family N-acetyltransferase [Microvirga pudoricolor]MBM6594741.1 GNAT family N-acetyltransferase [Microvirga pudoricolor]